MRVQTERVPSGHAAPLSSMERTRDGSVVWWGRADTPGPPPIVARDIPVPLTVGVSPVRPGHAVNVEYRVNQGRVCQAVALPEPRADNANSRTFRAMLPGQTGGLVEFLPVLRFAGQPVSPRLLESTDRAWYRVASPAVTAENENPSAAPSAEFGAKPRWAWSTRFLGSVRISLRTEVVGPVPDGLRINWHVKEGSFVGPGLNAVVLPGAADWMRIRQDGVGIVHVNACIETRTGSRIYSSYGGTVDLGPEGYKRALRNNFDPLPPFVVTPTYATMDKQLEWLNRAQCIGVGRVDMQALRVEYDVYVIQVGGPKKAE